MDNKERQDGYLAKARQADEQASKCKDARIRDSWFAIAQSYRQLAERQSP